MPTNSEYAPRRARVSHLLMEHHIDGFLVTALPNVRYLSGFTGSNGAVLLAGRHSLLFTDPRYQTQAPHESDCEVKISKQALLTEVAKWLRRLGVRRLGFERSRMSFESYDFLKHHDAKLKLIPVADVVEAVRAVKSTVELGTIKAAVELNSAAFEQAVRNFKPQISETDLAAEIEYKMRRLGADGPSFETIVASGRRSALPHARPSSAPIQTDQLLLVDMGASLAGYASDMTRTLAVGRLAPRAKRIYKAVLESQLAAIDNVRAGVACSSVDRAARNVLKKHGLDRYFVHSTGHGLGLEIHESPRIGRKESRRLEAAMAITIEPGVYVEDFGGVRIEDTVVVTNNGCQVLTPTQKDLMIL